MKRGFAVARFLGCAAMTLALNAAEFRGTAPNIAADGRGGFVVSYLDGDAFWLVTIAEGKVSPPRQIAKGNLLVNRADFPAIAVNGRTMSASWSTRNAQGSIVHIARSNDGGATWSKARTPHPSMMSQFGFVSLTPAGDAVWLDGRGLEGGMEGAGEMQLHFGTMPFAKESTLDARVCDCCQTAMAMTSDGPIVAYRDRSPEEVRDIAVVRRTSKGWTSPKIVHADGWKIAGCPVNGPQLDARGKRVAIAWFTAANGQPLVRAAYSDDAGANFGKPLRVDLGKSPGRVDIGLLADGSAAVSWLEQRGDKSILFVRRTRPDGSLGTAVEIGEARGFPRLAISKENIGLVWTTDDRVRFTTIKLP